MQNNSSIISYIHNSRDTLLELMRAQGYDIEEYANSSLTETNAKYANEQLDMIFDKSADPNKSIHKTYVNYYLGKALRPAYINETIDDLFNIEEVLTKNDTLMIVTKDDAHDTIINSLKHMWEKDGYFVVVQNIKRLQFNILNHTIVPPHRILGDGDIANIMTRYNIRTMAEFPDISRFDPVAVAIGMRPGQLCEIIRPSKTAVTGAYYRVCS